MSEEQNVRLRNQATASILQRGLDAITEGEDSEDTVEIRKMSSQLDHLNDYMGKVEARLREHNEKMEETLAKQKAERENRRKSFHERLAQSQQEDSEYQQQLAAILNRVETGRNRASVYDLISNMEVPKVNGSA